jgi:hypothetical protein
MPRGSGYDGMNDWSDKRGKRKRPAPGGPQKRPAPGGKQPKPGKIQPIVGRKPGKPRDPGFVPTPRVPKNPDRKTIMPVRPKKRGL